MKIRRVLAIVNIILMGFVFLVSLWERHFLVATWVGIAACWWTIARFEHSSARLWRESYEASRG